MRWRCWLPDRQLPLALEERGDLGQPAVGILARAYVAARRTPGRRPRTMSALARPTGVGRAAATYEIPIEGRDEWLAAARRLA